MSKVRSIEGGGAGRRVVWEEREMVCTPDASADDVELSKAS